MKAIILLFILKYCHEEEEGVTIDSLVPQTPQKARKTIVGKSDVGVKRTTNEDTYLIREDFCLVADGMGGAAAGKLASFYFSEITSHVFSDMFYQTADDIVNMMEWAFRLANERIRDHTRRHPDHQGMGCTAELMVFYDHSFVLGHVGDSRTYCYRNGRLTQLTHDHSFVQQLVDKKKISAREAKRHPYRHVILRSIGTKDDIEFDIRKGETKPGDKYLLCSDGLSDMLDDDLIKEALSSDADSENTLEGLIELAKMAGGTDNITVVLVEIL